MTIDDRIVAAIRAGDYEEAARLEELRQCRRHLRRVPLVAGGQGRGEREVRDSAQCLAVLAVVLIACLVGLGLAAVLGGAS